MEGYLRLNGFDKQAQQNTPGWLPRLIHPGNGLSNVVLMAKIVSPGWTDRRMVARGLAKCLCSRLREKDHLLRSNSTLLVVLQNMREEEAIRSEVSCLFDLSEPALRSKQETLSMHGGVALSQDDKAVPTTLHQAHEALNYARDHGERYELYRSFMAQSVHDQQDTPSRRG